MHRTSSVRSTLRSLMRVSMFAASLAAAPPALALQASDLFGVWQGNWFVDEFFDNAGAPLPVPADANAALEFRLRAFDTATNDFGDIFIEGAISGKVTRIDVSGLSVSMEVTYPLMNVPEPKGFITSTFSEGWLRGDYDETAPMPPGWIGWRGPFELRLASPVPEISPSAMLCAGALVVAAAVRRRRL